MKARPTSGTNKAESAFFSSHGCVESFLLLVEVHSCRGDFIVPLCLEVVEALAEFPEAGDSCALVDVGTECHQAQDDAGLGASGWF